METSTEKVVNPEETNATAEPDKTVTTTEQQPPRETNKTETEPPEDPKQQLPEEDKEQEPDQPEWLVNELNSLNALKTKFTQKYKRTFKRVEGCQNQEDCQSMANDMYLQLMQRVLKTAGTDRGAVLLEKLQEKRDQFESSAESGSGGTEEKQPSVDKQIDEKIKESINSVKESLKELENQLEEGNYVQTKLAFGGPSSSVQKINLSFEKPPPEKKRVQKLQTKTAAVVESQMLVTGDKQSTTQTQRLRSGPWGVDEEAKFIEAVRIHGKDWNKIADHIATRDRRQIASFSQQFRKKNRGKHDDLIAILEGPPFGPGGSGHILAKKGGKRSGPSKSAEQPKTGDKSDDD